MSSNFEPQFLTNNYKIEINILYNSDDIDDTKDNYYIINNMKDILLEEFSNKDKYDLFNTKYDSFIKQEEFPIYIINEPFYLDKRVMDSIRKTSSISFPNYKGSRPAQKTSLINNFNKFNNDESVGVEDKKLLLGVIKEAFLAQVQSNKQSENIKRIKSISTLQDLFGDPYFLELENGIGGTAFHDIIKDKYYSIDSQDPLKKIVAKFYNISDTNLSNKYKYEYFLRIETIKNIYKFINQNSTEEQRSPLNNNQTKEELYNKYLKYVFPDKKDANNLSDPDKDKILMFNNVFYIIKNIYLYDNTIIKVANYGIKKKNSKDNTIKKYYISDVRLPDLTDNITHFTVEENKVKIYIKATLKAIIENPILQINYVIDDLEDVRQRFSPQPYILKPKDISDTYSKYNNIYIHNTLKYIKYSGNIDQLYKYSLEKKDIQTKEEVFLNTKTLKLFKNYLPINKGRDPDTNERNLNINFNIKFLLYKIFKFYNNKKIKNYYIIDTYVKYWEDSLKYYSITAFNDVTASSEKYEIISKLFKKPITNTNPNPNPNPIPNTSTNDTRGLLYYVVDSTDARLENNKIYKINVVFRCYLDKTGAKPDLKRRIIAEKCLSGAQFLDEAFSDVLYKTFDLPENYLYNKLSRITKKKQPVQVPTKETEIAPVQIQPANIPPIKVDNGRGGKLIKNYNNNKTRKHKL